MELLLGDCLERMRDIPESSVDMVLTSPPYDNLRDYGKDFSGWGPRIWKSCLERLFALLKVGGTCVWVVSDATIQGTETGTSFRQALWAMECGFRLHDTMIWSKTNPPPQTKVGRRYTNSFEYMFVLTKGAPATFNPLMQPCLGAGRSSGSKTQRSPSGLFGEARTLNRRGRVVKATKPLFSVWTSLKMMGGRYKHPAQFPIQLAFDHVYSWSNEGDIVLDPFMGVGTTGAACQSLNRRFIGIELDPVYYQRARERLMGLNEN